MGEDHGTRKPGPSHRAVDVDAAQQAHQKVHRGQVSRRIWCTATLVVLAVQLTVRLFGLEFLHIELADPEQTDEPGDCTTSPVGFVPSWGDQRWEKGVDT